MSDDSGKAFTLQVDFRPRISFDRWVRFVEVERERHGLSTFTAEQLAKLHHYLGDTVSLDETEWIALAMLEGEIDDEE